MTSCRLQILQYLPYDKAVDWWAVGVLIYMMMAGQPPFMGEDQQEMFVTVQYCDVIYPKWMTNNSVTIVEGVCQVV